MILKRLRFFTIQLLFFGFLIPSVSNADISSINNVHNVIYNNKNITVPIDSQVNATDLSSMKYLLTQIDKANEILNGEPTTSYANGSDAVSNPVSVSRVINDVDLLVVRKPVFELTLQGVSAFSLQISASGNFTIDWGDSNVDTIEKLNTDNTTYSHAYSASGNYTVKIKGKATGYNSSTTIAAISFFASTNKTLIKTIDGNLGEIFPAVNGVSPNFYATFGSLTGLTGTLPPNLFKGLNADTVTNMFYNTFNGCYGLTGSIPDGFFSDVNGAPKPYIFYRTFSMCRGLTGPIPENLFAGIIGPPAEYMFYLTFGVSLPSAIMGLTGSIPTGLFSGISGSPAQYMFYGTFYGCRNLTGEIPDGLFAGISGVPAAGMFNNTFGFCTSVTKIPSGLFANINGAPAANMFNGTFGNCKAITNLPSNLFGTFTGEPAASIFSGTFADCNGLTSIDDGIWDLSGLNNTNYAGMFDVIFRNCSLITGETPNIAAGSTVKLWQHFSNFVPTTALLNKPFASATGFSDYANIPAAWK